MSILKNKEMWVNLSLMIFALAMVIVPEMALAGNQGNLQAILNDRFVVVAITLGFGLVAAVKWIEYAGSWGTSSALTGLIAPAILTFMAFQWQTVLSWFGLG